MWKFHFFYCCFCCRHRCWCCFCSFSCTLLIYSSSSSSALYASVKLASRVSLIHLSMSIELTLHTHCFTIRYMLAAKLTNCIGYVSYFFFALVRVHSIGAGAVATLFMSHIRNAYSKRSNFLHQCFKHTQVHEHTCFSLCVDKYGCFLFQLLILIHFLFAHMN